MSNRDAIATILDEALFHQRAKYDAEFTDAYRIVSQLIEKSDVIDLNIFRPGPKPPYAKEIKRPNFLRKLFLLLRK